MISLVGCGMDEFLPFLVPQLICFLLRVALTLSELRCKLTGAVCSSVHPLVKNLRWSGLHRVHVLAKL